jgi:hypothetical protein
LSRFPAVTGGNIPKNRFAGAMGLVFKTVSPGREHSFVQDAVFKNDPDENNEEKRVRV